MTAVSHAAETHQPTPPKGHSCAHPTLAALIVSTSFLSGCQTAPDLHFFSVPPETRATLAPEREATLSNLDSVQSLLEQFEKIRKENVGKYGFLLVIPAIGERYEQAVSHHRQLCLDVAERKELVLLGVSDLDLMAINTWCGHQHLSLSQLQETVAYVEKWHSLPYGWAPPSGYEYLKP